MFKNVKMKIKNIFKNKNENKNERKYENEYITPVDLVNKIKNIDVPDIIYCEPEIEGRPNILIMDDFIGMAQLIKDELNRIQCCDVYKNFNILIATGNYAAFTVKKFLELPDKKIIDVAILDITLGGVIDNIEYDGIDIAIMLKKHNPNCVIKFLTGHTLNEYNPEIFKFMQKFKDYFKIPIDATKYSSFKNKEYETYAHIINKNGNRVADLGDLLQTYYDLHKSLRS